MVPNRATLPASNDSSAVIECRRACCVTVSCSTQISQAPATKLTSGIASIPIKIDAGISKVIKAETDPFIPSPSVYLAGTEPMIAPGLLPNEPPSVSPNRDAVNLIN